MFLNGIKYILYTWLGHLTEKWSGIRAARKNRKVRNDCVRTIERVGQQSVPSDLSEVRLFSIMRNESLRLPHFISYYQKLGVDRFFILDNDSTDNSTKFLSSVPNAHLFSTKQSYVYHWYWMEYLLDNYGKDHWCVVVDIDELFYYPHAPELSLKELSIYLDERNETAVHSLLLDMYPNGVISETTYCTGQNPLSVISYFDKAYTSQIFSFSDRKCMKPFSVPIFTGGMRDRIFGKSNPPAILSKVSFFRYLPHSYLVQGMHAISNASVSTLRFVVLHTKFLSDFINEVQEECQREQHFGAAFYYKIFNKRLVEEPGVNFYNEASVKLEDWQQLLDLGIMKTVEEFDTYTKEVMQKKGAV